MQTSNKKNSTNHQHDPNVIVKVAEILSLLEEATKTKEWIFQQIKKKAFETPSKKIYE